jgi:hypothetical protein
VIFAALWASYFLNWRPWFMNWGATPEEQAMELPGDQLLPNPAYRFTRAITIHAPAAEVWPWIVQMGEDRAGFYSYTWLENLTGASIHNADMLHPEWQARAVGDYVLLARSNLLGGIFARVARTPTVALEPGRMITHIPCRFVLQPVDARTTRLLVREPLPSTFAGRAVSALAWDPMHFVMEQRMLRGIKERAEHRPRVPAPLRVIARIGWLLAGAVVLGMFVSRRRWWPWLLVPLGWALPIARATGDWDAALAAFLATGITVLGALALGRRWWPPYLLIASVVALVLLFAADAYTVFGLAFGATGLGLVASYTFAARRNRRGALPEIG